MCKCDSVTLWPLDLLLLLCCVWLVVGSQTSTVSFNSTKLFVTFPADSLPSFDVTSAVRSPTFLSLRFHSLNEVGNGGEVFSHLSLANQTWEVLQSSQLSPENVTTQNITFWSSFPGPNNGNQTGDVNFLLSFTYLLQTYVGPEPSLPASKASFYRKLQARKPLMALAMKTQGWPWNPNATQLVLSASMNIGAILFTTENTTASLEVRSKRFSCLQPDKCALCPCKQSGSQFSAQRHSWFEKHPSQYTLSHLQFGKRTVWPRLIIRKNQC